MSKIVLAIVACVMLAGCKPSGIQPKNVAFVLPAGFEKAESDDGSVAFAVPATFRKGANNLFGTSNPFEANNAPPTTSMTADEKKTMDDITNSLSDIVKEDERRNLEKLAQKGIILHCVSKGKPIVSDELTRFYVKRKSKPSDWTWIDVDESEQDCFKDRQKATEAKLPIGTAHRMQASWQLADGSHYTQISYLVPKGSQLYVLRFITVEAPEVITSIEKQVAESLRVN